MSQIFISELLIIVILMKDWTKIIHVRNEGSCRGRPIHSVYFRLRVVVELLGEKYCGTFSCQTEHINSLLIIDLTNTSVSAQWHDTVKGNKYRFSLLRVSR